MLRSQPTLASLSWAPVRAPMASILLTDTARTAFVIVRCHSPEWPHLCWYSGERCRECWDEAHADAAGTQGWVPGTLTVGGTLEACSTLELRAVPGRGARMRMWPLRRSRSQTSSFYLWMHPLGFAVLGQSGVRLWQGDTDADVAAGEEALAGTLVAGLDVSSGGGAHATRALASDLLTALLVRLSTCALLQEYRARDASPGF